MKILFLDFDGVLNKIQPHEHSGPFSKAACAHVNTLLHKHPDLRIVFSTAWRHKGIEYCREVLKENGIDPIRAIDCIPTAKEDKGKFDREKEIKAWLDANKHIEHFVIIDDWFAMPHYRDRFVKTNSYVGLTEAGMLRALEILDANQKT